MRHAWTQSVPPAGAGGYVVDALGSKRLRNPPATAGGDCVQQERPDIEQPSFRAGRRAPARAYHAELSLQSSQRAILPRGTIDPGFPSRSSADRDRE